MISTLALFAIGFFFAVVANYFLSLWIFNRKEEEMTNNIIKYLEREEKRRSVEG